MMSHRTGKVSFWLSAMLLLGAIVGLHPAIAQVRQSLTKQTGGRV